MSLCVPLSILQTSHNTLDTPFLDYHIHNSVLGVWAASQLWHAPSWVTVERSYKKWGKKKIVTILLRGLPWREASPEFITSAAEREESRKKILPEFVQRNAAILPGDRDQRLCVPRVKTESSFIWSAQIGLLLALSAPQWWSKVAEKFLEVEVCLVPTPLRPFQSPHGARFGGWMCPLCAGSSRGDGGKQGSGFMFIKWMNRAKPGTFTTAMLF